jgi:hypothetical protein
MKMKEKLHVASFGFMCKLWQVDNSNLEDLSLLSNEKKNLCFLNE